MKPQKQTSRWDIEVFLAGLEGFSCQPRSIFYILKVLPSSLELWSRWERRGPVVDCGLASALMYLEALIQINKNVGICCFVLIM